MLPSYWEIRRKSNVDQFAPTMGCCDSTQLRENIPTHIRLLMPFLLLMLLVSVPVYAEMKYDFHKLVKESEVVVETDGQAEQFDTSIVVQVASYTSIEAADSVTQNLTEDFADLSVVVKTVPRDGYFTVRISGFKDSRSVAFVMDQLVKAHFAPIKLRPR